MCLIFYSYWFYRLNTILDFHHEFKETTKIYDLWEHFKNILNCKRFRKRLRKKIKYFL